MLLFRTINHARPCIDSQDASPAMFDHHFHHRDDVNEFHTNIHTHLSSLNTEADEDDDDDMELGDEAGADLLGNMSDDDGNVSHNLNVSPTMDDDDDEAPELIDSKPLRTPPLTPPARQIRNSNTIDRSTAYTINETYNPKHFSSHQQNVDLYGNTNIPTVSNNYSSSKQNLVRI